MQAGTLLACAAPVMDGRRVAPVIALLAILGNGVTRLPPRVVCREGIPKPCGVQHFVFIFVSILFSSNPYVFVLWHFRYLDGHKLRCFFSCSFNRSIGLYLLLIHQQSFSPLTAFLLFRLEKYWRFPINVVAMLTVCTALLHQSCHHDVFFFCLALFVFLFFL